MATLIAAQHTSLRDQASTVSGSFAWRARSPQRGVNAPPWRGADAILGRAEHDTAMGSPMTRTPARFNGRGLPGAGSLRCVGAALGLAIALLASACGDACKDLSERICRCERTEDARRACITRIGNLANARRP